MAQCPICKKKDNVKYWNTSGDTQGIDCKACGKYEVTHSLYSVLDYHELPYTASCWLREQTDLNSSLILMSSDLEKLKNIPEKRISHKYELMLKYICNKTMLYGTEDELQNILIPVTWVKDIMEHKALIKKASDLNHLITKNDERKRNSYFIYPTYDGLDFVENLGYQTSSNKIFMAFQFNDEMKEQFEPTIKRAVVDASDNKLEAVRVSSSSTNHDTKIDDELIGMLKSSKAVIADFTGQRNAVYYEAGYAMGLGIPVIWTCREDDAEGLSFDTRQYPHIIWKDEDDLYTQVVNRLKAKIL